MLTTFIENGDLITNIGQKTKSEIIYDLAKTQIIRGGLGKTSGGMAKIKAIIPLIVPLIIQSIKKSEALADAITMRCFT